VTVLKRLMARLNPPATLQDAGPAAPAPVAAAADFQKTMGRDRVTGLPHRACFAHVLALQGQIAARLETRLSVVVIDWPGYGEPGIDADTRDRRLVALAAALRTRLHRTHDVMGCIGPGRLAAMLPFTDGAGADTVARKLQQAAWACLANSAPPAAPAQPGLDGSTLELAPTRPDPDAEAGDDTDDPADQGIGDAGEIVAPPRPEPTEIMNVGISAYNGKGVLADDALLKAAERAVAFAALNAGDRVVRFDP
jgi:GGDEF domain-containing protein